SPVRQLRTGLLIPDGTKRHRLSLAQLRSFVRGSQIPLKRTPPGRCRLLRPLVRHRLQLDAFTARVSVMPAATPGPSPRGPPWRSAPHVPRLMLTVPIWLPCFPLYSRTTTTPWSISGRKSGFAQLPSFIVGVNFASNVVLSTPFDSASTSVYMTVSLSPGPTLAPSNLVSGSTAAGAAPLAWPAISASLLWSVRAALNCAES